MPQDKNTNKHPEPPAVPSEGEEKRPTSSYEPATASSGIIVKKKRVVSSEDIIRERKLGLKNEIIQVAV